MYICLLITILKIIKTGKTNKQKQGQKRLRHIAWCLDMDRNYGCV